MFSVPLRRALVAGSDLPYPEGVAAAEVLKVGSRAGDGVEENQRGLRTIVPGTLVSAGFALLGAMKLTATEVGKNFKLGAGESGELGRESCRERGATYGESTGGARSLTKKKQR